MSNNGPITIEESECILDAFMKYLPEIIDNLRMFTTESVEFNFSDSFGSTTLTYMNTIGGEKFCIRQGGGSGDYYAPLGNDDDIILQLARLMDNGRSKLRTFRNRFSRPGELVTFINEHRRD